MPNFMLIWRWVNYFEIEPYLLTQFDNDSFDVKKIGHLVPPPGLVQRQKVDQCRKTFLQYYGLVRGSRIVDTINSNVLIN